MQLSQPSSSPPMHHHLLLECHRRRTPPLPSLIRSVLCPIIHASYICGVCSTPHPSSTFSVITLCVSDVSCVSLCQALATGAPSQPLRVTVTPPELSLASCYIGKRRRWLLTASPADRVENRNVFLGFSVFLFCFFTTSFTRQCCV